MYITSTFQDVKFSKRKRHNIQLYEYVDAKTKARNLHYNQFIHEKHHLNIHPYILSNHLTKFILDYICSSGCSADCSC